MDAKLVKLEAYLAARAPMLVAFSGGVDSSFLLAVAQRVLGNNVTAIIADSPSLPRVSLGKAKKLAAELGANLQVLKTTELTQEDYATNPVNRCYFCKAELFKSMDAYAAANGFRFLAYGENLDDAGHVRPGVVAAREFSVCAPLKECGLTKLEIRQFSREIGLPTADDAAQPCLSSRIPHGVRVTSSALQKIELAEEYVRSLGFQIFRVRHLSDESAKVQIAPSEMSRVPSLSAALLGGVRAVGYREVEIDPLGYRSPT
ncbi:MAG: ATP-dependent sacrificial sulfur transferase LarE [Chthoniobacterales bacterium]